MAVGILFCAFVAGIIVVVVALWGPDIKEAFARDDLSWSHAFHPR